MPYEIDGLASLSLGVGVIVAILLIALWLLRRVRPTSAAMASHYETMIAGSCARWL